MDIEPLWRQLTFGCRLYFRLLPVGAREGPFDPEWGSVVVVVVGIEIEPSDLADLCLGSVGSSTTGAVCMPSLR